ncbi:hypothetical protein GC207_12775 [bacterium]|nr:hypothetical protein [bacterium]
MKLAHYLMALAFSAGCCGLRVMMRILEMLHIAYPPPVRHGGNYAGPGIFEEFCRTHASWLPFLGIPAIAYAVFVSLRGKASVESFCLFTAVLACVFVVLLFVVLITGMISWIYLYD